MKHRTIRLLWCVALAASAAHAESMNAEGLESNFFDTTVLTFDTAALNEILLKGDLPEPDPAINQVGMYGDLETGIENGAF